MEKLGISDTWSTSVLQNTNHKRINERRLSPQKIFYVKRACCMNCFAVTTRLSCVFACFYVSLSILFMYVFRWGRYRCFFKRFFFLFSKWIVVHDSFFQFPFLRNSENVFVTNLNTERSLIKDTSLMVIYDFKWKLLKSDNRIVSKTYGS